MKFRTGSYANVASTLALVVALGGTSYAAVGIAANSVGSKQIVNNSVKSADVKNGGLKAVDFAAGELPAGATGPAGPAGATGATGATGVAGAAGAAGAAGSARAYAYVTPATPSLLRAKGFSSVRRASSGLYCLTLPGVDVTQVAPLVAVEFWMTSGPGEGNTSAMWDAAGCNAGEVGVRTDRIPDPYGPSVPSNTVAFTVMVP